MAMKRKRHICLDVYDYDKNKLCCLYDSRSNAKGQAYDIVRTRDLSGWKEISFNLPFMLDQRHNFRWNFIKSEYYLRVTVNQKSDWYIIHSPKKTKNNKSITNTVKCSHISSVLKTKNLYQTFDDTNGIGTIKE